MEPIRIFRCMVKERLLVWIIQKGVKERILIMNYEPPGIFRQHFTPARTDCRSSALSVVGVDC